MKGSYSGFIKLVLLSLMSFSFLAHAQITQLAELTASDGEAGDNFGRAVAISGNTAVVTAPFAYGYQTNALAGAAYVFTNSGGGWTQVAKLSASDGRAGYEFGSAVAITGNTIAVGADLTDSFAGAVYVFVQPESGWADMTETAKLSATQFGTSGLGSAVAISRDETTVLAAALQSGGFVYARPSGGWAGMTSPTVSLNTNCTGSNAIAVSGNTIVLGCELGPAFVYRPQPGVSEIEPVAVLTGSDLACSSSGYSIAFSGDTIASGAGGHSPAPGSVCVFVEPATGWTNMTQTAELTLPVTQHTALGFSVAFLGTSIVSGAPGDGTGHNQAQGAIFGYAKPANGWVNSSTPRLQRASSDGGTYDEFGSAIAASETTIVVGAPYHKVNFNADQGAAYIFGPKQ